jgi:hypothetical protein
MIGSGVAMHVNHGSAVGCRSLMTVTETLVAVGLCLAQGQCRGHLVRWVEG